MSLTAVTGVTSGADDVSGEVFKILKDADGARESVMEALRRWDPQLAGGPPDPYGAMM